MSNPLARRIDIAEIIARPASGDNVMHAFLSGRKPATIRQYRTCMKQFAAFLGVETIEQAGDLFLKLPFGKANEVADLWRTDMSKAGLKPNTVNNRLAALMSVVKLANRMGVVTWRLSVQFVKARKYKDTAGPTLDEFRAMIKAAADHKNPEKRARDLAILGICGSEALRRAEVYNLDLDDYDLKTGVVWIMGKGANEKEALEIPEQTLEALKAYLSFRGEKPGPLFISMGRGRGGGRLTGNGFYYIIQDIGNRAGIIVTPHKIRHFAATVALGHHSKHEVQGLTRHSKGDTLDIYDDNRKKRGKSVATTLDRLIWEEKKEAPE